MINNPTRFALHAMYKCFISKWGNDYAPEYKDVEEDWIEITSGLSDEQVRKVSYLIVEEMTGFPGTIHLNKYASAVKNDVDVKPSNEEKMAMEIINFVCERFPGEKHKFRVSDALEIAASVFYVNDNTDLESDQEVINELHIKPRKSMLLVEASKWVNDSYENKGKWQHIVRRIQETYDAKQ